MSQSERGGRRHARMGGPYFAGPEGYCICPNCGYREIYCPGLPCVNNRCPKCGIKMRRQ